MFVFCVAPRECVGVSAREQQQRSPRTRPRRLAARQPQRGAKLQAHRGNRARVAHGAHAARVGFAVEERHFVGDCVLFALLWRVRRLLLKLEQTVLENE